MRKQRMPVAKNEPDLSRRERQIMDVLFARGRATGQEIQAGLPDKPNYSSVRTILRVLERKGYVRHLEEGCFPFERRRVERTGPNDRTG